MRYRTSPNWNRLILRKHKRALKKARVVVSSCNWPAFWADFELVKGTNITSSTCDCLSTPTKEEKRGGSNRKEANLATILWLSVEGRVWKRERVLWDNKQTNKQKKLDWKPLHIFHFLQISLILWYNWYGRHKDSSHIPDLFSLVTETEPEGIARSCVRGGSRWLLGKGSSPEIGSALEKAARVQEASGQGSQT